MTGGVNPVEINMAGFAGNPRWFVVNYKEKYIVGKLCYLLHVLM